MNQLLKLLAENCSRYIRFCCLYEWALEGIDVESKIQQRKFDLTDILTFGICRFSKNDVAKFVSAQGAVHNGKKILTVLVPYQPNGNILSNRQTGTAAADFFYICEDNKIIPVIPKDGNTPFILDAIEADSLNDYGGERCLPYSALINGIELFRLANDKLETKKALADYGISVPAHHPLNFHYPISLENFSSLNEIISSFPWTSFVIKAATGSCGQYVRLFDKKDRYGPRNHAFSLLNLGLRVYVEQRIEPVPWFDEYGNLLDWNIRAFVTFSPKPEWIDGEVRYSARSRYPVNVSRGSCADNLDKVLEQTGVSLSDIKDVSIESVRALYSHCGNGKTDETHVRGYVGLDLMVNENSIYVIEANVGNVGGFGTLMSIRKQKLWAVSNTMIPALGPMLEENSKRRTRNESSVIQEYLRVPITEPETDYLKNILLSDAFSSIYANISVSK